MSLQNNQQKYQQKADNSELSVYPSKDQVQNVYDFCNDYINSIANFGLMIYEISNNCKSSKLQVIVDAKKITQIIKEIQQKKYFIIQTWSEYNFSYKGKISLILLAFNNKGYLIDCLALKSHLLLLKSLLQNPKILKICYSELIVINDLKRDLHIFACNLMDLEAIENCLLIKKNKAIDGLNIKQKMRKYLLNKKILLERGIKQGLLQLIQEHYQYLLKIITKMVNFFQEEDNQYQLYHYINSYQLLLKEYQHPILSQIQQDNQLSLQNNLKDSQNKENTHLNNLRNQQFEENQKTEEQFELCTLLMEWRQHMAKMKDISVETFLPYQIISQIVSRRSHSLLEVTNIFKSFYGDYLVNMQLCQQILNLIQLHQEKLQNEEHTLHIRSNIKQKEDYCLKSLLKQLDWDDSQEWLNRKNDESIKLYKQIVSVVEMDSSVIEQYTEQMDEKVITKNQLNKYVKYAQCFRNGNHKQLKEQFSLHQSSQTLFEDDLQVQTNEEEFIVNQFTSKSATQISNFQHNSQKSEQRINISFRSSNNLPSQNLMRFGSLKTRPLPQNIEQIYIQAANVKKNYSKVQKKKKQKNIDSKTSIETADDYVPTNEDLKTLLQL